MKNSPAEKAGIQPKDVVTKVNGKSIKGQPLEAIVKKCVENKVQKLH